LSGDLTTETLYDKEWVFILQMLYRLFSIDELNKFQRTCLEQLRILIPCTKAVFFLGDREAERIHFHTPVTINTSDVNFDNQYFINSHFPDLFKEYYFAPWSRAFRHSDSELAQIFANTMMYKEVYAPQNIHYALKIVLIYDDHLLGDIGLFRPKSGEDFSARDLRIVNLIKEILAVKLYRILNAPPQSKAAPLISQVSGYPFTRREAEVLELLREGETDHEICRRLFISPSTLKKHIHQLYQKTEAKSRVQIVKMTERGK
jgi:DNA-binding CsgD family transcriptional regulator